MSDIPALLERYRRGPEVLALVLTGVFGEEEDFILAPGKWSVRQIVAHVADSELVGAHRMRLVAAEDNPALAAFDQDAWVRNLDYARRKPKQSLETFRRIPRRTTNCSKACRRRRSSGPARIRKTVRSLCAGWWKVTRSMPKITPANCRRFARHIRPRRARSSALH